jgi:hypothetical protein
MSNLVFHFEVFQPDCSKVALLLSNLQQRCAVSDHVAAVHEAFAPLLSPGQMFKFHVRFSPIFLVLSVFARSFEQKDVNICQIRKSNLCTRFEICAEPIFYY